MNLSSHRAKKRFGQHWLKDEKVLDKIITAAELKDEDHVLEIGPGKGALTKRLLGSRASRIHSIELDRDLIFGLKRRFSDNPRFSLKEGDVLKVPLISSEGMQPNKVVANIPYNITGPILTRLIGGLSRRPEVFFDSLVLLLQKEVAERILAEPGSSSFSAMSVRIQLLAKCKSVCDVPPRSFEPPPKIHSKVLLIEPINKDMTFDCSLAKRIDMLLNIAFAERRKKLRNTIGGLRTTFNSIEHLFDTIGISLDQRPQEINPSKWVDLAKGLSTNQ